MTLSVDQYQRLQRQVAELQRDHDRTAGGLDQTRERLRAEHGCKTTAQAKKLIAKLERELAALEREFARELKLFEKEIKGY